MGNTVSGSKDRHIDDSVDFGSLSPQGVYTGPQDWNQQVVGHLIVDRKLAPFYRPLEEYEESWEDDSILAARKENPNAQPAPLPDPPASASSSSSKFHHKQLNKTGKEPFRPTEASVYRGAVECPICFLYYPPNINRSRCCDQAICTECFVQIKRAEPTTTHLVSEPASCPYCVQDNFGVTYDPPPWRTGLMKEGHTATPSRPHMHKVNSVSSAESEGTKRRKSFSADSPEVVTIDQIRPDWEAKLAAVRAAVTRRANRRIIMRQVGDRLVPIGVTSGRVIAEAAEGASGSTEGAEGGGGRRSSRRRGHGGQDLNQILGTVGLGGLGGNDLEELMMMEAMRLSLLEHEEQQRRQNNNGNSNNDSSNTPQGTSGNSNGNNTSPASSTSPSPRLSSSPATTTTVPAPRPPSPTPSPSSTPPRQSPLRSRFPITPSPLGNAGNAVAMSVAVPGSAPPGVTSHNTNGDAGSSLQPPRIHRRTGSNPGPSGSTLAAALSAAQTATAFLNPTAAGRQGQAIPHSAPATRAASPGPLESEDGATGGGGAAASGDRTQKAGLDAASITPPAVLTHTPEPVPEPTASSSAHVLAASPAPLTETSASEATTSTSEVDVDTSSREGEYQPLPSSIETTDGDPLLKWDK